MFPIIVSLKADGGAPFVNAQHVTEVWDWDDGGCRIQTTSVATGGAQPYWTSELSAADFVARVNQAVDGFIADKISDFWQSSPHTA